MDAKLSNAIRRLERGLVFLDQVKAEKPDSATGVYRDAKEWIVEAARDVVRASSDSGEKAQTV